MDSLTNEHAYLELAACYCRGRLGLARDVPDDQAVALGVARGLRVHRFKRNAELPRVRRVLGALRGFAPANLLDVGSGRGTFLWPLLDTMPSVRVTAVELDAGRAEELACVGRGGCDRLAAFEADARALPFANGSFSGAMALEVFEHMPDPERAAMECMRVASRFVVVSVPSHEDDNPEHLHVLRPERLETMLVRAGAHRVRFDSVHNHLIAIATR